MGPDGMVDGQTKATLEAIYRFNLAFGRYDVDGVMRAMTDDCVFENTCPPPDGERYDGQAQVRAFWERFFRSSPGAVFETEELFTAGDRCVIRWPERDPRHRKAVVCTGFAVRPAPCENVRV